MRNEPYVETAPSRNRFEEFVARVEQVTGRPGKRQGRNVRLLCPAHDDHDPSFDVAEGSDGQPLAICRSQGCSYEEICGAIGWKSDSGGGEEWTPYGPAVAVYQYTDEEGRTLFDVCRTASKEFPLRRPDPSSASGWRWNLDRTRRVLYRLPDVLEAAREGRDVLVTEGEKDADALAQLGLAATCNPGGAGKWRPEYTESLQGAHVIVIPDADRAGREHAEAVAESLSGVVQSVRILDLAPHVEDKSDVSDFLALARTEEERAQAKALLIDLARKTPVFIPHAYGENRAERNTNTSRLPFAPISEVLANVPSEPPWTWDGYLAPGTIMLLAGRPKVGKSTLTFGLIGAIAAGRPFLARATAKSGVLLLTEERHATLKPKADRFSLDDGLHVLLHHTLRGTIWSEVLTQAVDYCEEHDLRVLVVDTFHIWTGLPGDAENNAGAVLEALAPLALAASRGLAVLVVAHQRKALGAYGEAVRGSNALIGGVDIICELERPGADLLASDSHRVLHALSRFDSTPTELILALDEDGYAYQGDSLAVRAEGERDRIIEALDQLGAVTADEIADTTGIPAATVRKRLKDAIDTGEVIRTGAGKRGDPYRFSLASLSAHPDPLGAETKLETLWDMAG